MKQVTNTSYKARVNKYHIFSMLLAFILTLSIGLIGEFGKSPYGTCFILKNSKGINIEIFPLVFNFPLILIFGVFSIKLATRNYEPILISLGISNFLLSITLTISAIFSIIGDRKNKEVKPIELKIAALLGACSGLVLSASRLFSKSLFNKIKQKVFYRRSVKVQLLDFPTEENEESKINYLNSTIWNLSEFFDSITKKTVAEILITLHLRFQNNEKIENFHKLVISYPKIKYLELENKYPYIEHCKFYLVFNENCRIVEYSSDVFSQVRRNIGLRDDFLSNSLILADNFSNIKANDTNPGGKSESFFFLTSDSKFVLKTIKPTEKKTFLRKILNRYVLRISNIDSKIVRILGVFRIFPLKLDFVIMENIVPFRYSAIVYDIKGYANNNRKGKKSTQKDLDFIEKFEKLSERVKNDVMEMLKTDFKVLRDIGVMDYSLLIGVYNEKIEIKNRYEVRGENYPIVLGIIDIFQEYDYKKKFENKILKVFSNKEFSCIDPFSYYNRIVDFLIKYL